MQSGGRDGRDAESRVLKASSMHESSCQFCPKKSEQL